MNNVEKKNIGGKWEYTFNEQTFRTSKREYKYACVATTRLSKGAASEGRAFVISLGNNYQSTYNSMARSYSHCDLEVVEINTK